MDKIPLSYQEQYILVHGYGDLIPNGWFSSKVYKSIEEVYKTALEKGITWRELTGWNEDMKGNDL